MTTWSPRIVAPFVWYNLTMLDPLTRGIEQARRNEGHYFDPPPEVLP